MAGTFDDFQFAIRQGISESWDGNWADAAAYFKQALQVNPDHPMALKCLARALVALGSHPQAYVMSQKAAQLASMDPGPLTQMAEVLEMAGRLPDAVRCALRAAKRHLKLGHAEQALCCLLWAARLKPDELSVHNGLAVVYGRLGYTALAAEKYMVSASILQRMGSLEQAGQAVEKASRLMPDGPQTQPEQVILPDGEHLPDPLPSLPPPGLTHGPVSDRTPDLGAVVKADPLAESTRRAVNTLASFSAQLLESWMGSPGPGLGFEQLTYGQEKFPRPSGQELHQHLDSALSLITDAQPMAAARELWLLQEFGLEHPALCWLLGDLLDESEPGNAMHHLQRIVDHPDFGLAASLQIGRLYNAHGRSREAAMAALQALRHADSETSKPDVDSDIYLAYDPALSSLSNEDDPHTLEQIYFGISAWLMQPGWRSWLPQERSRLLPLDQYGVQRPLADLFIEPVGGDMLAEITALRSLAARKSARFALEETLQTLGDFPESFSLQLLVADLLWLDWQRQDAINKSLLVARIFNLRDEKGQAIRILRRMSRRGAIDPALHQQLLELLHSSLRMEEALAESVQLARLYYQGADLTSSRAAYEDSLRITEKSPDRDRWKIHILNKIADIDLQRLDHRSALAVFEQICGLLPDDAYARSRLVELKYRLGQKDAANAGLESYLEMQKKHGRQEEALAFLKGLVEIMSDETSIHLQLARVYLEAGQREACVAQLDTVAGKMLESGNPRGAGTILKKIISLQPDNISAYEEALRNLQTRLGAG